MTWLSAAARGQLACYRNDGRGGFKLSTEPLWSTTATRDQTTILGWGPGAVLIGYANYEDGLTNGSAVQKYQLGQGPDRAVDSSRATELIPADDSSVGPLAVADYDGDGVLDLFVGVFHNDHGVLREITRELGLADLLGWWNGVTTGDVDGDGRPDIIAGNWGRNTKYEHYRKQPLRIYYGDFNGDGFLQLLEVGFEPALNQDMPIRRLDSVTKGIPSLIERFPTYDGWAQANMDQVRVRCLNPLGFAKQSGSKPRCSSIGTDILSRAFCRWRPSSRRPLRFASLITMAMAMRTFS